MKDILDQIFHYIRFVFVLVFIMSLNEVFFPKQGFWQSGSMTSTDYFIIFFCIAIGGFLFLYTWNGMIKWRDRTEDCSTLRKIFTVFIGLGSIIFMSYFFYHL